MTDFEQAALKLLTEIRDLLAYSGSPEELAAREADSNACQHPEDQRIDLSAMGEIHWKCRACQFEFKKKIGGSPAPTS